MRRKTLALATEEDLLIDLTFHKVSASLVADFKEKIGIKGFYWVGRHLVPRTLFLLFLFFWASNLRSYSFWDSLCG
jgi:hypothetical protein